jgi:hypothetical protein
LWPLAVFFAISVATIGWHLAQYPYLSPIDENAHYDYMVVLPDIPAAGERLSQESLRMTACRGYAPDLSDIGLREWQFPRCNASEFDPGLYPGGGFTTAGPTPPMYYAVTAAVTRPLAAISGVPLITWARAFNVFWLTGLMLVSFLLARRLGVSRVAATASAVLIGTSSEVITSASTLGPDVATAVTGGVVMLAALAHDGTRRATAFLLVAVAVAALTKLTTFTAVGAAMIYLAARPWLSARGSVLRERAGRSFGLSALIFGVFGLISGLWGLRYSMTAIASGDDLPINAPFLVDRLPWGDIRGSLLTAFVPPIPGNFSPPFLEDTLSNRMEGLLVGVLVIGVLVTALALRTNPKASAFGLGVLVLTLSGPFILVLLNFYANGLYVPPLPRYGFGVLAGFAAATAWAFRGLVARRALVTLSVASVAVLFL